ncbi:hypothetical protein EVAR_27178_1 [Eumeta japonica]|uniref:Uncharacterized protein n=1 Tax=Eumeta variegata TaxID=151549 RepID=A0A4C1W0H5_EUMVA|nr:hypothetical protein EVAR_27178_1 [Eumeta japonica]
MTSRVCANCLNLRSLQSANYYHASAVAVVVVGFFLIAPLLRHNLPESFYLELNPSTLDRCGSWPVNNHYNVRDVQIVLPSDALTECHCSVDLLMVEIELRILYIEGNALNP